MSWSDITAASGACTTKIVWDDEDASDNAKKNLFRGIDKGPIIKFQMNLTLTCTNTACANQCSWSEKKISEKIGIVLGEIAPGLSDKCLEALSNCDSGRYGGYASEAICFADVLENECKSDDILTALDWGALGDYLEGLARALARVIPPCRCPVNGNFVDETPTQTEVFPFIKGLHQLADEAIKRSLNN